MLRSTFKQISVLAHIYSIEWKNKNERGREGNEEKTDKERRCVERQLATNDPLIKGSPHSTDYLQVVGRLSCTCSNRQLPPPCEAHTQLEGVLSSYTRASGSNVHSRTICGM